jgi:hypothetical protein
MEPNLLERGSNGDWISITREDYSQRMGDLVVEWSSSHEADLDLRFRTGALLNQRFGDPDDCRQRRGQKVLKEVAERLKVSESDISRMRRFAFYFGSAQDMKEKHPEATTWSAVKDLLPKLKAQANSQKDNSENGGVDAAETKREKSQKFRGMKQSLANLASKLEKALVSLDDKEKKELAKMLGTLVKMLKEHPQILSSVDQVSAAQTPPAALAA